MTQQAFFTAVEQLQQGGVIGYATEAVFGIGCDPDNGEAVQRVLTIKERPVDKGLVLIAADVSQLLPYLDLTRLPEGRLEVILASWPGPYTWIIPARPEVPEWLKAASRERFGIISEEFMGCFNNKPREMQAARLEEISGFDDDVDLKAPIEPMEHIYYGELKKVRSLVAASASTGSADTQRHYRLLLYKIDQALK